MRRRGSVEIVTGGMATLDKPRLVVPGRLDPRPVGSRSGPQADPLDELLDARGARVDLRVGEARVKLVLVRVVEPGQERTFPQVHDLGARAAEGKHVAAATHGEDTFADDRHSLRPWPPNVGRVDVLADEDEIGRSHRSSVHHAIAIQRRPAAGARRCSIDPGQRTSSPGRART